MIKGLILFEGTTTIVKDNYYNVSEVLKKYPNKRASEWFNSNRTKEYVKALINSNVELSTTELMPTKKGGFEKGYTMVHQSLIIDFARWIEPRFAIACDNFIMKNITDLKIENKNLNEKLYTQQSELDYFWDKSDQNDLYYKR